jgi:uncharacterized small protein (DUF1192 family)
VNERSSRLSLALDLACAVMTVLVSGRIADKTLRAANKERRGYRPKPAVFDFKPLAAIDRREFRNGGRYHGAMTRVAKSLGVSENMVEMVSRGKSTSARILKALKDEIARIDANPKLSPAPLTDEERRQFARGGKYYGVVARTAESLGMLACNVHRCLRGKTRSPRILAAIRAEIARVDAEIAAKSGGAK